MAVDPSLQMVGEPAECFDLLHIVSLSLTISSVLALGLLVVVRTILRFTIQIEREGDLP